MVKRSSTDLPIRGMDVEDKKSQWNWQPHCRIFTHVKSYFLITLANSWPTPKHFSICHDFPCVLHKKKSTDLLKLKPTHVVPNGKSDEELAPSTPFGLFCAASNFMSFSWTDWIWLNLANSQVSLYTLGHLDMTRVAKGCHVSKMHFIRIIPLPQGTSGLYQRFFSSLVFTTWWEWPKSLTFTETSESTKPANRRTKRSHSFEKRHVSTYKGLQNDSLRETGLPSPLRSSELTNAYPIFKTTWRPP